MLVDGVITGGDISTLFLKPGHWRLSSLTTDLRACERGEAGACRGGVAPGDASCDEGHSGPLCRVCVQAHYFDNGSCSRCPDLGVRFAARAVPLFFGLLIMYGFFVFLLHFPERLHRHVRPLSTK